jgi:hypothetical protein
MVAAFRLPIMTLGLFESLEYGDRRTALTNVRILTRFFGAC